MQYPFLYFGSGESYFKDNFECSIWFKDLISENSFKEIIEECPLPKEIFSVYAKSDKAIFFLSNKNTEFTIKEMFDSKFKELLELDQKDKSPVDIWGNDKNFLPTEKEWQQFDSAISEWLLKLHKEWPILFVFKPADISKKEKYDNWHDWSLEKFAPVVVKEIENFYSQNTQDQKLKERVNSIVARFIVESLKVKKKDQNETLVLVKLVELLCNFDGITKIEPYDGSDQIIFQNAKTLGSLIKSLPENKRKNIVENLSPYSRLVLFAGESGAIFLLLFENPFEYVNSLLEKIHSSRKNILSNVVRHIMMNIYIYWRDKKPADLNQDVLIKFADLVVNLPNCNVDTFIRVELIFERFKLWEKILQLYTHPNFLLSFSDPVLQLKDVFKKFPEDQKDLISRYIEKIAYSVEPIAKKILELKF